MDVTGAIPTAIYGNYDHNHSHRGLADSLSDIRMEVRQTEADLLTQMASDAAVTAKDHADSTFRLHENIRNVGDAILTSSNLTQAQIAAQGAATANQFAIAAVAAERHTSSILAALSATELRSVQDKLDEYRHRSYRHETEVSFGNRFSAFQSQLNDLAQDQRTTNQAINFGSGRIGPQSATQNQVR